MDNEKKSFELLLREVLGPTIPEDSEEIQADLSEEVFGLSDAEDVDILMHRDAHFGGSFELMLEYYNGEGKGINQEFSLDRILRLYDTERSSGQDLAAYLLTGAEAEKVARVRKAYQGLRDICELDSSEDPRPKLITDLILTEDEDAESEVEAVVAEGSAIVPSLVQLLQAREFYDPLFPGYGYAPSLAAKCLGLIKDPQAIRPLFESIDTGDFFVEEDIFHALKEIGPEAKKFLLRLLILRPMTLDNERAARALTHFALDPEVAQVALNQLQDPEVVRHENLAAYLVLCCEGLVQPTDRERFVQLAQRADLHRLRQDIQAIAHEWKA